jgi:hypothetical protein
MLAWGCAQMPPDRLMAEHDVAALTALANHFAHDAETFRDEAKYWMALADYYDQHPELNGGLGKGSHAAHCREVARHLQAAADEAEAFAKEQEALAQRGQRKGRGGQTR